MSHLIYLDNMQGYDSSSDSILQYLVVSYIIFVSWKITFCSPIVQATSDIFSTRRFEYLPWLVLHEKASVLVSVSSLKKGLIYRHTWEFIKKTAVYRLYILCCIVGPQMEIWW